jgi:hypothetical protein
MSSELVWSGRASCTVPRCVARVRPPAGRGAAPRVVCGWWAAARLCVCESPSCASWCGVSGAASAVLSILP